MKLHEFSDNSIKSLISHQFTVTYTLHTAYDRSVSDCRIHSAYTDNCNSQTLRISLEIQTADIAGLVSCHAPAITRSVWYSVSEKTRWIVLVVRLARCRIVGVEQRKTTNYGVGGSEMDVDIYLTTSPQLIQTLLITSLISSATAIVAADPRKQSSSCSCISVSNIL